MSHLARRRVLEKAIGIVPKTEQIYELVGSFFDWDEVKTTKWFFTIHSELNYNRPIDLILQGRSERVVNFLERAHEHKRSRKRVRRTGK